MLKDCPGPVPVVWYRYDGQPRSDLERLETPGVKVRRKLSFNYNDVLAFIEAEVRGCHLDTVTRRVNQCDVICLGTDEIPIDSPAGFDFIERTSPHTLVPRFGFP